MIRDPSGERIFNGKDYVLLETMAGNETKENIRKHCEEMRQAEGRGVRAVYHKGFDMWCIYYESR